MADFAAKLKEREKELSTTLATGVAPLAADRTAQEKAVSDVKGETGVSFAERVRQREALAQSGVHVASPSDVDTSAREKSLLSGLEAQGRVPGTILAEPGMRDFGLRFDLGWSDTFEEKRAKFMDSYPDGDFVQVKEPPTVPGRETSGTGGSTILFRKHPTEPYAELDARAVDDFELVGDFADIAGDLPAMVVQAIITRGASIGRQIMQLMGGQIGGDVVKEVVEDLRGYQKENFGELTSRIGGRAATAAVGGAATLPITGPLNFLRGGGLFKTVEGTFEAQKAAKELGIPKLIANQIAASPLIKRMAGQSAAVVRTVGEYLKNQQKAAVNAFSKLTDEDALRVAAMDDVEKIHDGAVKQILGIVTNKSVYQHRTLTEGGEAIQAGLVEYEDLSATIVNRMYEDARRIDTPQFDINPVLAVARNVEAGVLAKGKGKPVQSSILDANGNPITQMQEEFVQLKPIEPQILEEISKLKAIDPSLPPVKMPDGREITATDQLLAIRSNLWELKQISPIGTSTPEQRQAAAQAEKLYSAITHVLKNPKNADPNFVKAWSAAQAEAAKRFDTLEKIMIVQASKSEAPAQLAARLAKPYQVDNLKLLSKTMPADKWRAFQDSAKAEFLSNPEKLTSRLDKFDKETLESLFTPVDIIDLRFVGSKIDDLNRIGIKDVVRDQVSVVQAISDLTIRKDKAGLDAFVRRVENLPPNDKTRRMVRSAIIQDVYNKVVELSPQGAEINGAKLLTEVKRLKEDKILDRVLTSKDRHALLNFEKLSDFLKTTEDSGTSLQAAAAASNIRQLNFEGFRVLAETLSTGRLITSDFGHRILFGTRKDKLPFARTRVVGAILAQEMAYEEDQKRAE
jgi:hypothetical protein